MPDDSETDNETKSQVEKYASALGGVVIAPWNPEVELWKLKVEKAILDEDWKLPLEDPQDLDEDGDDAPKNWDDVPDVLKVAELASILRVNVKRIYDAIKYGDLPAQRIGDRHIRISKQAVIDWLSTNRADDQ